MTCFDIVTLKTQSLKTYSGWEPVPGCEPNTYMFYVRWLNHCITEAGFCCLLHFSCIPCCTFSHSCVCNEQEVLFYSVCGFFVVVSFLGGGWVRRCCFNFFFFFFFFFCRGVLFFFCFFLFSFLGALCLCWIVCLSVVVCCCCL